MARAPLELLPGHVAGGILRFLVDAVALPRYRATSRALRVETVVRVWTRRGAALHTRICHGSKSVYAWDTHRRRRSLKGSVARRSALEHSRARLGGRSSVSARRYRRARRAWA